MTRPVVLSGVCACAATGPNPNWIPIYTARNVTQPGPGDQWWSPKKQRIKRSENLMVVNGDFEPQRWHVQHARLQLDINSKSAGPITQELLLLASKWRTFFSWICEAVLYKSNHLRPSSMQLHLCKWMAMFSSNGTFYTKTFSDKRDEMDLASCGQVVPRRPSFSESPECVGGSGIGPIVLQPTSNRVSKKQTL